MDKKQVINTYNKQKVEKSYNALVQSVKKLGEQFNLGLSELAKNHKDEIRRDKEWQKDFFSLCYTVGVDPLSSSKGFWADIFGSGDYYKHLTVSIINICIKTQIENGGLIPFNDLINYLRDTMNNNNINGDDIKRCIIQIQNLSPEYQVVNINNTEMLYSVPKELSSHQKTILSYLSNKNKPIIENYVNVNIVMNLCKTNRELAKSILQNMLEDNLLWVDKQGGSDEIYYSPSFYINIKD